ncbi:glycosyltransferase family 4 protein [uncultured Roseibium sp.]|uniref:glycosyltransferase family 4 protein n=1 Tax=uncultured Roseibium sp. TaxID=1936171 RepID=UPI003216AFCA
MKSVLFVNHTGQKGGAELFLVDLINHAPTNWAACFLSPGPAVDSISKDHECFVLPAESDLLSIKRESSFLLQFLALFSLIKLSWNLSRVCSKYDVICANSQKSLFVAGLASFFSRKPLVWILHDIITDPAFSRLNRKAIIAFTYLFCSKVLANSQASKEAFIASGGQEKKAGIIYNGFYVGEEEEDRALTKTLCPGKVATVGLFSRISHWKGQHVLLAALSQLKDVNAIIVGAPLFGEEAYAEELRDMVDKLQLNDRVQFLGFRNDVKELMKSVDIVVHTSIAAEPFGRVVVEGMISGTPVVATKGGGVTEIIREGETGILVPPNEPDALASAIQTLLNNPDLYGRLSRNGLQEARDTYSINNTLHSFQNVLDTLEN